MPRKKKTRAETVVDYMDVDALLEDLRLVFEKHPFGKGILLAHQKLTKHLKAAAAAQSEAAMSKGVESDDSQTGEDQ